MSPTLRSDPKHIGSCDDSSAEIQVLCIAAWVWVSYLVSLAYVDLFIYASAPNSIIIGYYVILGFPALVFLGLSYSKWSKTHAHTITPLMILLISIAPVLLNHLLPLPVAPLSNMEGMVLRQLPVLLIGLVLVAWHYKLVTMILYSLGTNVLELLIVCLLGQWGDQMLLNVYYVTIVRTVSFIVVGIFINQLITRLRAQQESLKSANHQLSHYASTLETLAMTDPLTGVFNRRQFFDRSRDVFSRAKQLPYDLAVLMIDIDHFKKFNDCYGHAVGDLVLCEVARRLAENLRTTDMLARYGGEEFTVLLPRTDCALACDIAERLLKAVVASPIHGINASITVSIGVAILDEQVADMDELMLNADQALYQAKRAGRNRWVLDSNVFSFLPRVMPEQD
jgi:diguanylate cyclase (GGDEF)-like protein